MGGDLGRGIDPPGFGGIPGVDDERRQLAATRSLESSSQRWVYGLGIGAAWEADVWGRVRSKKAAAQAESDALAYDYEFARQSLAAAVARAYFSTIEASQQAANAQETLSYYSEDSKLADVRKEQGHASDFRSLADQSAHRFRAGCALHGAGRASAGHPRDRSCHQPLSRRPPRHARVHFPANREPCPPVCPRNCSNAGPIWSRPNVVSPPRFIA